MRGAESKVNGSGPDGIPQQGQLEASSRIRSDTGDADDVRCLMSDGRAVDRRGELSGVQEHEGGKDGKAKGREKSRLFI